jgi:N-dimethylarginine dimethylaminohydrolase
VVPQDEQFPDGGDIILHNGTIFCGTNKRRKDRIKCLEKQFGKEWNIEPIEITQDIYGEEIVHLDCVFNPIAADEALVCPSGMTTDSERKLEKAFSNIITVSGEEQSELGVNVLSLGGKVLVAQARHRRINHELASRGYRVRTTGFDAHASHGGAFRCITSPRLRDAD